MRAAALLAVLLLAACSAEPSEDVAPLPEPTEAGAQNLMAAAERAAADAARPRKAAETNRPGVRSAPTTTNEVVR